jgi:hypothetical protein
MRRTRRTSRSGSASSRSTAARRTSRGCARSAPSSLKALARAGALADANITVTRRNEINLTLGEAPEDAADPMSRGAGEAAIVAPMLDVLDGMGVSGRGWHAPGEPADLSRLPVATKRAALLIYRRTRPGIP